MQWKTKPKFSCCPVWQSALDPGVRGGGETTTSIRNLAYARTATGKAQLVLAVVISLSAVAMAQPYQEVFSDVSVSVDDVLDGEGVHGYVEYRVRLRNHSATRTHQVTLTLPDPRNSYGKSYGYNLQSITQTVTLPPASAIPVSMFQPALELNGRDLSVAIDGVLQQPGLSVKVFSPGYRYDRRAVILVSRGAPGEFKVEEHSYYSKPATTGVGTTFTFPYAFRFHRSPSAVAGWSEQWLGYSRYDAVVVTGQELDDAPEKIRSALASYVEVGGMLLILGTWQVPRSWQDEPTTAFGLTVYSAGFGQCLVSEKARIEDLSDEELGFFQQRLEAIGSLWTNVKTTDAVSANARFPVAQDVAMPVRGMFVVLLLFTILIGPVNYWILARKKKKMWFLLTVPLIAFIACLLIFGYFLLSTGWKRHARDQTVTVLDERTHRASTIGWRAFYSTTTPSKGLKFAGDTELTPFFARERGALTMDLTAGQDLTTGWIAARVPAHFLMRRSETRKEGLIVKRDRQGKMRAVNMLSTEIRKLTIADEEGRLYWGETIPPGASVALKQGASYSPYGPQRVELDHVFSDMADVGTIQRLEQAKPRRGCYIAILNASPFVEEALEDVTSRESYSVVYGILKGIEDEN